MNIDTALSEAADAFRQRPDRIETGLDTDSGGELLLRKACRLLAAIDGLADVNGYHTLTIEVSFAVIERSMEYYIVSRNRDPPATHTRTFEMAAQLGLVTDDQAEEFVELWESYRNENYYDDGKATSGRAAAMRELATVVHRQAVELTQGGTATCLCD